MLSRPISSFVSSAFVTGLIAVFFLSSPAQAYFSVIQTGDVIEEGGLQATFEPQVITTRYDGLNANIKLDVGVDNASSVRGIIGLGDKMDFEVGGMYKYIPFPDTANQPAIGFEAGAIYASTKDEGEVSLRFNPLVSKRFETEIGDITPYASVPLGVTFRDGDSSFPIQLALGSELRLINAPQLSLFGEVGLNVHDAFGYLSLAAAWRFDGSSSR